MNFEEWWKKRNPYIPNLMGDFEDWPSEWKVKQLAHEAFQEGWDACRARWSGLDYNATQGLDRDDL
jgi:hypothetical protein